MCVTDPWAHMSFMYSILSLKLGVTSFNRYDRFHVWILDVPDPGLKQSMICTPATAKPTTPLVINHPQRD